MWGSWAAASGRSRRAATHFMYGRATPLSAQHVGRIDRVRLADAGGGERFADRLEVRLAVLLDERFEEGHAEHFAFAFVDAGGEVLVDVVAEQCGRAGTTGRRASS